MTTTKSNIVGALVGALLILLILSPFSPVQAIKLKKTSIAQMFKESISVAVVKIKMIKSIEYYNDSKIINCGFDYEAEITKAFKGDDVKVKFRSHNDLAYNKSYLIFFNSRYQDGDIRFLAMDRNDVASYETCKENSPKLYTSGFFDEIFSLDSIENLLSKRVSGKDWVIMKSHRVKIPDNIETKFMDFNGADLPKDYSNYYSHTLILRDDLYRYLETLQAN